MVRRGCLELDLILILIVSGVSHIQGAKAFTIQLVVWILFGVFFHVGAQKVYNWCRQSTTAVRAAYRETTNRPKTQDAEVVPD